MSEEKKVTKMYDVSTPVEYVDKKDGDKKKTFWQKIGTGFSGSKGISIDLNALPVNGKIFIVEHTNKEDKKE